MDEYGSKHISGHEFDFEWWEVLNEIEGEHGMNASSYTALYDAIVSGIRFVCRFWLELRTTNTPSVLW